MKEILIIGGGPGGYVAAIRASQLGMKVTVVEEESMGGVCLNVGCIPTKALLETAHRYSFTKSAADFGVNVQNITLDVSQIQARRAGVVSQMVGGVEGLMKANGIEVLMGKATFKDNKKVLINLNSGETTQLTPDKIIIATGSRPSIPPIPGIDAKQCMDSTQALVFDHIPESLVIIGGGVIGVEMATVYATLGCKVTIIEMEKNIIPMLDTEMTRTVGMKLKRIGVEILNEAKVMSIDGSSKEAVVTFEHKEEEKKIAAEKILVSVGRKFNTDNLGLENTEIITDRGRIIVNDKMETNISDIYAIGDCTGGVMLAHVASMHGEVAAENAAGHDASYDGRTNPSCIYTDPEFASVGLSEDQAKLQELDYITGKFPLMANGKTVIMGDTGSVKIVANKADKKILGVHIVGPRATDLIAEACLAIGMSATLDDIISTIHGHPTINEAVREAAWSPMADPFIS